MQAIIQLRSVFQKKEALLTASRLSPEVLLGVLWFNARLIIFFSPAINKHVETKEVIEAAKALKEGNFTEKEARILIEGDDKLERFTSAHYKTLEKQHGIKKVEATIVAQNLKEPQVSSISRRDFNSHIVENFKGTNTILNTTIKIVSPVLVNVKNLKWKGKFNGETISFAVKDDDFLTDVSNRVVKFESGTSIACDLQIVESGKRKGANTIRSTKTYIITKVHSWSDGNNIKHAGKILKKDN